MSKTSNESEDDQEWKEQESVFFKASFLQL